MIQATRRYVIGHWVGSHGLAWSVWVNLVSIRIVVSLLQEWLGPQKGQDFHEHRLLILLLALLAHGVLFIWQAVGTVRASEAHIRAGGSIAPVWGMQLVLVLAFFWVVTYVIDAWQVTSPIIKDRSTQAELAAARAAKYSITPTADGRALVLTGSLEGGITKNFAAHLAVHPNLERIVLNSAGGNIYEARGLSQMFRQFGLTTTVYAECSSACTTAFIGGSKRQLGPDGKLGFHQYRIDANYAVLTADPEREQEKDRALFLQSGVAPWFLDKMFDSLASDLWYPDSAELLDANVITEFVSP